VYRWKETSRTNNRAVPNLSRTKDTLQILRTVLQIQGQLEPMRAIVQHRGYGFENCALHLPFCHKL